MNREALLAKYHPGKSWDDLTAAQQEAIDFIANSGGSSTAKATASGETGATMVPGSNEGNVASAGNSAKAEEAKKGPAVYQPDQFAAAGYRPIPSSTKGSPDYYNVAKVYYNYDPILGGYVSSGKEDPLGDALASGKQPAAAPASSGRTTSTTSSGGGSTRTSSSSSNARVEPAVASGRFTREQVLSLPGAKESTTGSHIWTANAGENGARISFTPLADGSYKAIWFDAAGNIHDYDGPISGLVGNQGAGAQGQPALPPQPVGLAPPGAFPKSAYGDRDLGATDKGVPIYAGEQARQGGLPTVVGSGPGMTSVAQRGIGTGFNPLMFAASTEGFNNFGIPMGGPITAANEDRLRANSPGNIGGLEQGALAGTQVRPVSFVSDGLGRTTVDNPQQITGAGANEWNRPVKPFAGGGQIDFGRLRPLTPIAPEGEQKENARIERLYREDWNPGFRPDIQLDPSQVEDRRPSPIMGGGGGRAYAGGGGLTLHGPATLYDDATGQPIATMGEVRPEGLDFSNMGLKIDNSVPGTTRYDGTQYDESGPRRFTTGGEVNFDWMDAGNTHNNFPAPSPTATPEPVVTGSFAPPAPTTVSAPAPTAAPAPQSLLPTMPTFPQAPTPPVVYNNPAIDRPAADKFATDSQNYATGVAVAGSSALADIANRRAGLIGNLADPNADAQRQQVATAQRARDVTDYKYGAAGLPTPTNVLPPFGSSGVGLSSTAPGTRYMLLTPEQQYERMNAPLSSMSAAVSAQISAAQTLAEAQKAQFLAALAAASGSEPGSGRTSGGGGFFGGGGLTEADKRNAQYAALGIGGLPSRSGRAEVH